MDNEFENRLLIVQQILKYNENINIKEKIKNFYQMYKNELDNFKYIEDETFFHKKKTIYVRYIGFNNKINYGGFFYKFEKKNNTTYVYLVNTKKQIWYFDFNKNFVFVNKVITEDDKIRKAFTEFLDKNKN